MAGRFAPIARTRFAGGSLAFLAPLRKKNWVVYAKPPFAGPEAVLAYLRVTPIASQSPALDEAGVTFRYKDYRRNGQERYRTMTPDPGEFIRRFLLYVLPRGFHRFATMGCLPAPPGRQTSRALKLLAAPPPKVERGSSDDADAAPTDWRPPCPCCGGRMIIIETFERGKAARAPP
ncbi:MULTISPECIES: transposase [unclassified Mesorhizobium]|uniref:transposase n=1 Tax=unclassified Mesorhizobium TaxID=325217 RepID=UPI003335A196